MPRNSDASYPRFWPNFLESYFIKAGRGSPNEKQGRSQSAEHWLSIQSWKLFQESQGQLFRMGNHFGDDCVAYGPTLERQEKYLADKFSCDGLKARAID